MASIPTPSVGVRESTPPGNANNKKQDCLDTPIADKVQGKDPFCFDDQHAQARYARYAAAEARKFFLGPMPIPLFLDTFFPTTTPGMPPSEGAFKGVPERGPEKAIYEPLVAALNSHGGNRCPGFVFRDTSTTSLNPSDLKPDICVYDEGTPEAFYTGKNGKFVARLGYAHMVIEVKGNGSTDFFSDPQSESVDRSTHRFVDFTDSGSQTDKKTQENFGQNVAYATHACAKQHRLAYYSVSVIQAEARLIRWDRSGAIATESFSLHANPEFLCEFVWRYAHATDVQRGFDNTVSRTLDADHERLFREVVLNHVRLQTGFCGKMLDDALAKHYDPGRVAIAQVFEDGSTEKIYSYLVSRPVVSPISMASRATRGYWAVSLDTGKIAFLKDTWRYDVENLSKEGDILWMLRSKNVSNIPVLVHHGDVPLLQEDQDPDTFENVYQSTRNHEFTDASWVCGAKSKFPPRLIRHTHYRLVLGTVGYPLDHMRGTKELLSATFDAYQAMTEAFTEAGTIHRDISAGNIILVRESEEGTRRGYLIDWELSCEAKRSADSQRKHERTGTWPFMSHRFFLRNNRPPHSIVDDMESMMYVVLYCGVRWLPHDLDDQRYTSWMKDFFGAGEIRPNGMIVGGNAKLANRVFRNSTDELAFDCEAFSTWLTTVLDYNAPPWNATADVKDKWNDPLPLLEFWGGFLRDHPNLPENDRVTIRTKVPEEPSNSLISTQDPTIASGMSTPFQRSMRSTSETLADRIASGNASKANSPHVFGSPAGPAENVHWLAANTAERPLNSAPTAVSPSDSMPPPPLPRKRTASGPPNVDTRQTKRARPAGPMGSTGMDVELRRSSRTSSREQVVAQPEASSSRSTRARTGSRDQRTGRGGALTAQKKEGAR